MNKIFSVFFLGVLLTGCASAPKQTIEQKIASYENKCLPLMNTVIEEKLSSPKNTNSREKWEEVILGDYRAAKDVNNSELARNESIGRANLTCMVQERLR